MTRNDFERVVRLLESAPGIVASPLLDEQAYIYHENGHSKRIIQSTTGELRGDEKHKLQNAQFDALSTQVSYTLRVSVAREVDLPTPTQIKEGWARHRHKKRREFKYNNSAWCIHATEVLAKPAGSNLESITYEVELELPLVDAMLTEADTERQFNELNAGISFLLHVIIKARQNSSSIDWVAPSHISLPADNHSYNNRGNAGNSQSSNFSKDASSDAPYVPHPNLHPDSHYQRSPNGTYRGDSSSIASHSSAPAYSPSASSSGAPFAPQYGQAPFQSQDGASYSSSSQQYQSPSQPIASHHYVVGAGSGDLFSGINLAQIRDHNREREIKGFLSHAKSLADGRSGKTGSDFWGTMPISFSRKHMEIISKEEYYISEKTDGVRYLMLISSRFGVVFVNRSGHLFDVVDFSTMPGFVAQFNDTILDGELVRHQKTQNPYFLIFDCVKLRGTSVAHEMLPKRLMSIGKFISHFRDRFPNVQSHPFSILGKTVMPKAKLATITSQIATDSEKRRIYTEGDGVKRCHLTDGLIIAPANLPYAFGTCFTMFKWKYVDLQSIDFLLRFEQPLEPHHRVSQASANQRRVELHINMNQGRTSRCKTTELLQKDFEQLMSDLAANGMNSHSDKIIAEMAFEPLDSTWRYHRLRTDKKNPNHISIAFDTMEAIAENVTIDDILEVVSSRH